MTASDSNDARVRLAVYRSFARSGRAPSASDLASELALGISDVETALARLEARHALALAPSTRNVWMAHPFSAVPTPYPVVSGSLTYWGNCAWDACAIPPLLGLDATVTARCPDCGDSLFLRFEKGNLAGDAGDSVVHFVVRPLQFWENVGYT